MSHLIEGIDTSGTKIPFWFSDCKLPTFPQLNEDMSSEICIIGAGIAGLTIAYLLSLEGKEVVVLEDGNIGSGETGRTSGHLCSAVDDHYFELEKVYGAENTKLIAESHSAAIDLIEQIIQTESIDCDFRRLHGYLFLAFNDKLKTLHKEEKAAARAGLKAELLLNPNINDFKLGPVLKFSNQAKFHPLKYLAQLSKAVLKKGGKIFTLTHASDIKSGKVVEITTTNGYKIKTGQLVIATNSPIFDRNMLFSKQEANRTYMIGVSFKKNTFEDALFWDTGDPYHYLRFHSIGSKDNIILSIGGEDHRTGKKINKTQLFSKLEKWGHTIIPNMGEVKFHWSGQIMEPVDHLAFIGPYQTKEKNIFVVTGDSGNGLTHGTLSAILLTDQIKKKHNTWSDIYNPKRKPTHNLVSYLKNNLTSLYELMQYLTPGNLSAVKNIKKDEGAIIRKGLHKLAVYRDKEGTLHYCSAVCPHMKGLVRWNELEKSWDCPLHGSRFTPFGEVMNGPSISDLKRKNENKLK